MALFETRSPRLHQKKAGAFRTGTRVGFGHHNHQVSVPAVGDERLTAIDDEVIAITNRRRLNSLQVATRRRFSHGDGTDQLTAGELWQVFFLLRVGAVVQQIGGNDLAVQTEANARVAACSQHLHLNDRIALVIQRTTIRLRHGHTKETVLTGLTPYGFINIALYLPVSMVRGYLLVNKALKGIFERQVISVKQGALDHEQTPKI